MSHFTVLVTLPKETNPEQIEQKVEAVLAPFDENKEAPAYIAVTAAELQKEIDEHRAEWINNPAVERDAFTLKVIEGNITPQQWAKEWHGYDQVDDAGNALSTYNKESKWDWWVIGGRWSGLLGKGRDVARVREMDFEALRAEGRAKAEKNWEAAAQEEPLMMRYFNYGIEKNDTKESYVRRWSVPLSTFTVLTKDGEWVSRGAMGWWAVVSDAQETELEWAEKFHERFIAPLDPEDILVVVDCHI